MRCDVESVPTTLEDCPIPPIRKSDYLHLQRWTRLGSHLFLECVVDRDETVFKYIVPVAKCKTLSDTWVATDTIRRLPRMNSKPCSPT